MQSLSVLMPVYNESRTLRTIVGRVLDAPIDLDIELLCVDDCSTDDSWSILEELAASDHRIQIFRHAVNRGKGAAIRTAIEHTTGDIAIVQDSDLEYDPDDYPVILKPILEGRADAVYGSRFAASPERRVLLFWHSLGNRFLTGLCNMVNDLNLTDMETCYKAIRTDLLKSLRLESDRFGIEPEITTRLAQWGARIYEVPISYDGRTYAEGKNIGWRDGVQALWLILKFRFFDTRFSRHQGKSTREGLPGASRLDRWIMDALEPHLGRSVLEAGCGVGNLTRHLLDRQRLVAIDIDDFYVDMVDRSYGHLENVEVQRSDLEDPAWVEKVGPGSFDTVVSVNVLDHLEDPATAVAGFRTALRPGGKALVLVPAHETLSNQIDAAFGRKRRFEHEELVDLFTRNGFDVIDVRSFNKLGVLGWRLSGALGRTKISRLQAFLFNASVPLARRVDAVPGLRGLSMLLIACVPHNGGDAGEA